MPMCRRCNSGAARFCQTNFCLRRIPSMSTRKIYLPSVNCSSVSALPNGIVYPLDMTGTLLQCMYVCVFL